VVIFHPLLRFGLLEALNVASDKTKQKQIKQKPEKLILGWGTKK